MSENTIFHVIPEAVFANTYHGSYKDTISRVRFLESHCGDYRKIRVPNDHPDLVLDKIKSGNRPRFLIEYSLLPKILVAIREMFPDAFVAVRSHNIEPFQHLDNHGWWSDRGPVWNAYAMSRLFAHDLCVKRHASVIWSISDWETQTYWARLPGKAKCIWLPYHCPSHLINDSQPPNTRRTRIVCLPTMQKNRKSWDLVTRFIELAEVAAQAKNHDYEFLITGDLSDWGLPQSDSVCFTGMIEDLRTFLDSVKSVALLSHLGYGFKTTIGDAIANNASVLIHPSLARRCPSAIQDALLPIDTRKIVDPDTLIQQLDQSSGHGGCDRQLRALNEEILQCLIS